MPNSTGSSLETRIVGAVADLWESSLRLRSFVHSFVWFQTILIPKEYDLVINSPVKFGIPQLTQEDFSIQANKLASDAEKVRPFVGESIWAYFSVYRTFGLRQALKVIDGLSKGHLHEWDKDLTGNPDRYGWEVIVSLFGVV